MNRDKDWKAFCELMDMAAECYRQPKLSDGAMSMAFMALSDLTLGEVSQGVARKMQSSKFCPNVADIREAVMGTPEQRASAAYGELIDAMHGIGSHRSVIVHDAAAAHAIRACGGWIAICSMNSIESERVFMKHYIAAANSGICGDKAERFAGWCDTCGYMDREVVDILAPRRSERREIAN